MTYTVPSLPTVARTMSAAHLNAVANHPDVRPWLGGDGPLDLTATLANQANLAFVTEHGGFVLIAHGQSRYEAHSLFLPDGRGREAIDAMHAVRDYIFAMTDAREIVTKVPCANRPAAALARMAGFTPWFQSAIPFTPGAVVPVEFFGLTLQQWALRSASALTLGRWFHEAMADALTKSGSVLPAHSDADDAHDRMAGAAALMVRYGNVRKAEWFYNQWATFVGFPTIRVLRELPTVIDLEGVVVEVRGDQMEVLSCR